MNSNCLQSVFGYSICLLIKHFLKYNLVLIHAIDPIKFVPNLNSIHVICIFVDKIHSRTKKLCMLMTVHGNGTNGVLKCIMRFPDCSFRHHISSYKIVKFCLCGL